MEDLDRLFYLLGIVPALHAPGVGRPGRIPGRRLLAVPDQHVPPRRLGPHHRQHVDAVDLRRQRRGPHGPVAVHAVLPALRAGRGGRPLVHQSAFRRPDRRGLGSHRGSPGCLLRAVPARADRGDGPDLLLPAILRGPRRHVSPVLGPEPGLQRDTGVGGPGRSRGRRLVGARRRFHRGVGLAPLVRAAAAT